MRSVLCFVAVVLALAAPAVPAAKPLLDVVVDRDLTYGRGGDVELKLDIARPRDRAGPFPAILIIHGGFWRIGDRKFLSSPVLGDCSVIEYFAQRGFVAATPSYRLVPTAQFPAQLEDCKAAVRWLRANAQTYSVDPNRIAASGYSSGGHLACLLGVTDKSDGFEGAGGNEAQSSQVQAVIDLYGPTDLLCDDWGIHAEIGILRPLIGARRADRPDLYRRASPVTYLHKGRPIPPFFVVHGAEDGVVKPNQSKRLVNKLSELGVKHQYRELTGEGHGWYGTKLAETLDQSIVFLRDQWK